MTTIENIQAPSIRFNTNVVRKAGGATLAIAITALVVVAVVKADPANTLGNAIYWASSMYFFVLCTALVGVAALGVGENAKDARKTQYDIR